MDIKRLKNKRLYYPAIFVATLFFFGYGNASASTLQINSNSATLPPGSIMTLSVILNSEGVAINNAEAKIIFPTDLLEVVSINKGNSIFSFWVEEPTYSNLTGTITFNGGIPTPGFNGSSGTVISIVVKAKTTGWADLIFSDATVRANDGLGTDVTSSKRGISINVIPREQIVPTNLETEKKVETQKLIEIRSSSHPDQTKWYPDNAPEFKWKLPEGTLEVRTLISKSSSATPSVSYIPPISSKEVSEMADGASYFSLQARTSSGWGPVSRYRVNIDMTLPTKSLLLEGRTYEQSARKELPVILFSSEFEEFEQILNTVTFNFLMVILIVLIIILIWYALSNSWRTFGPRLLDKIKESSYETLENKIDAEFNAGNYLSALSKYFGLREKTREDKKAELGVKISKAVGFFTAEETLKKVQEAVCLGNWLQAKALLDSNEYITDHAFRHSDEAKKVLKNANEHLSLVERKREEEMGSIENKLTKTEQDVKEMERRLAEQKEFLNEEIVKREKTEVENKNLIELSKENEGVFQKEIEDAKSEILDYKKKIKEIVDLTEKIKTDAKKQVETVNKRLSEAEGIILTIRGDSAEQKILFDVERAERKRTEAENEKLARVLNSMESAKLDVEKQLSTLNKKLSDADKAILATREDLVQQHKLLDVERAEREKVEMEKLAIVVKEKKAELANLGVKDSISKLKQLLAAEQTKREKAEESKKKEGLRFKENEKSLQKAVMVERNKAKSLLTVISKFKV